MKMMKKLSKRAIALFCMFAMIAGCVLTYTGPLGEANSASAINDEWNMFSSEEGENIVNSSGKPYIAYSSASVELPEAAQNKAYLELYVKLWLKDSNAVNILKTAWLELANNTCDKMELSWSFSSATLVPGMNELAFKFSKAYTYDGSGDGSGPFDPAQMIKYFRIYTTNTEYSADANGILLYDVTIKNENSAGLNFGQNDSHLQLTNKLTAAPEAIEASVKLPQEQTEWVLRSAQETSWNYGLGTNATYHTVTDGENGPEEGTSYVTTTMSAGGNFGFTKSFNISIPEYYTMDDIALDFWFKTDTKEATMGYIDLTSAGTYSDERRYFNMNTYLKDVVEGEWYHVVVPVSKGVQDGANPNKFDLQGVDYLRWHSTKMNADTVFSITDVKLVVIETETATAETKVATEWPIFAASSASKGTQLTKAAENYDKSNENDVAPAQTTLGVVGEGEKGPKAGTPYTQISATAGQAIGFENTYTGIGTIPATGNYEAKDLAVAFWIYCDNADAIPTTYFSLSTYGWRYNKGIRWNINLKDGWNYMYLRFDSNDYLASDFDHTNIKYAGFYASEPWNDAVNGYAALTVSEDCSIKVTDVKLVVTLDALQDSTTLLQAGSTLDAAAVYGSTTTNYKGQEISNGFVTGEEANEMTPPAGTKYTTFDVDADDYFFIRPEYRGINVDMSTIKKYDKEDLSIGFWLYNEKGIKMPNWSTIHISSGGWTAEATEYIYLHTNTTNNNGFGVNLRAGWNYIEIPLTSSMWKKPSGDNQEFDYTNIRFFQFYWSGKLAEDNIFKMTDIQIVPSKEARDEYTLSTLRSASHVVSLTANGGWWNTTGKKSVGDKFLFRNAHALENGPDIGTNVMVLDIKDPSTESKIVSFNNEFSYRVKAPYTMEDLALDLWVYSSENISMNGDAQLMLHSTTTNPGSNMIYWPELSGISFKKGWNHLSLKLSDATQVGTFDLYQMCYLRWEGSVISDNPVLFGVSDINLVTINEPIAVTTAEVSDTTTLQYNQMIFSNINATGETSPYALYINMEGQPTLLWGTTAFTLNCDVRTGKWVDIKAVRNADKTVSFYIDNVLVATSSTNDLFADDTLSFTTAHRIAADGTGSQMMVGRIANLRIYSDAEATTCTGNWPLTGDIQYILTPMEDTSGNNNNAVYRSTRAEDWIDYDKTQYDFLYNEEGEEDYWSMVFVPDIQNITQKYYGYDQIWYQTAQWIADNIETENIKHVIGAGDNSWSNIDVEYEVAKAGFDKFSNLVSWSNMSGNHEFDWGDNDNRTSTKFTNYFGLDYIQETKAAETYMGSFDDPQEMSTVENSYFRFQVNGVNWMILQLEYHPRLSVLKWAKEIAAKYPADNIIMTTHSYISGSGTYSGHSKAYLSVGDGDQYLGNSMSKAWEELQTCSNIKLILCGHSTNGRGAIARKMETNAMGQTVPALMINAQDKDLSEPGSNTSYYTDKCLGMISIIRFSADGTQAALQWYSPQWGKSFNPINLNGERDSCTIQLDINKEAQLKEFTNVTGGVAPATENIPEGYIFAGWYTDNTCTKAIASGSTAATAYAKFVDADILSVKVQVRLDENNALPEESKGTDMRFATTVDTADYKKVGFHVVCEKYGIDKFVETTKVYKKLYKVGQTSGEPDTVLPTEFSPVSEYFLTYTLLGVNEYDVEIEMTPYWVTADGTTVYGQTTTKSVSQFNKQ